MSLAMPSPDTTGEWEFLPFSFDHLDEATVLMTNLVGEQIFLTNDEFDQVRSGVPRSSSLKRRLASVHILRRRGESLPVELLAMKLRTQNRRLAQSTALHMFVVTLRCEHSCRYCQVSRQASSNDEFDMSPDTALRGLEFAFRSPSRSMKIEFQGGEPLLNFPMVRYVVEKAKELNREADKDLAFVIASNLVLLDDEILEFCEREGIYLSTSLDGPSDLHNRARPRPGMDSWERVVDGVKRAQDRLGPHRVSALLTTSAASLDRVTEIIDTYVGLNLHSIFLRPMSPYGFALRPRSGRSYEVERWLSFYAAGLDYIIELNRNGYPILETWAAIIAKKMFTNDDSGYVDLASPAGIGLRALVYNYDGGIYASDEGRMLAEMGDLTFRLGQLGEATYDDVMLSEELLAPQMTSLTHSAPMCVTCAYRPYCGSDPVFHHTTQGDFVGHKPTSEFCQRNLGVFRLLTQRARRDPYVRELFIDWAHSC
ncbi:MAG TPA: His-Xaa-Ser system radical SAM maturase HxsB [Acidimicrobiales bacterium]|nr:His-Xaa-Ser system radical SAM maturase HxsB [Acidimicrobiales bacterium]